MKKTITVKRAELLNAWLKAVYANNEAWYSSTLWAGIPDGDELETVLSDLADRFYDDDLDDMLAMYNRCEARYGKDGWFYNGRVYHDFELLKADAGIDAPGKIYAHRPRG